MGSLMIWIAVITMLIMMDEPAPATSSEEVIQKLLDDCERPKEIDKCFITAEPE